MVLYCCVEPDEKKYNSVAFQAYLILNVYSYNVTIFPVNIVTTYDMVIILVKIPVHQIPRTRANTNPTNIMLHVYDSFFNYSWIFLVQSEIFRTCNKFTRRVSKFACRVRLKYFPYDITQLSCCLIVFAGENSTVFTICPCNH